MRAETASHILLDELKAIRGCKNPLNGSLDLPREGCAKAGSPRLVEYRRFAVL